MDLIRIRATKLDAAAKVAAGLGLILDRVYGDSDNAYVNVGGRRMGVLGNHEPRWTAEQRAQFSKQI